MNISAGRGLAEPHFAVVAEVVQERHHPEPVREVQGLTMVCMDTRSGDPECPVLADDHEMDLVRQPGGISGASRRASGAWAVDDPESYLEESGPAHINGLRLRVALAVMGIDGIIHFGCKDNKVAVEAATAVADRDPDIFEIAKDMRPSLTRKEYQGIADGQARMLDAGHIALEQQVIADYMDNGIPIATLHGPELRGISLVDNRSRHTIKPMPKRHTPEHDDRAIYITDTGLVVPTLARAARAALSKQIKPSTVAKMDTIHKATLVKLLDLPYAIVT